MEERDNHFDYDCSNEPWPEDILRTGQEAHGLENTDPEFLDPAAGDFRLRDGSPCRDRGLVIDGFTQGYSGPAPDIGAYDGEELVEGPPFQTLVPPDGLGFEERPRVTRHRVSDRELRLFFSWPLDAASLALEAVHLAADGARCRIESVELETSGREVVILAAREIEGALQLWLDPLPLGDNGQPATHWASTIETLY
jgi:hypothetical protein